MRCRECAAEDVPLRRVLVAPRGGRPLATHHECERGHRFHLLWDGARTATACDCDGMTGHGAGQGA